MLQFFTRRPCPWLCVVALLDHQRSGHSLLSALGPTPPPPPTNPTIAVDWLFAVSLPIPKHSAHFSQIIIRCQFFFQSHSFNMDTNLSYAILSRRASTDVTHGGGSAPERVLGVGNSFRPYAPVPPFRSPVFLFFYRHCS